MLPNHEEVDRLLQELAAAHNRRTLSTEATIHYAERLGRQHPEDLMVAVGEWKGRDRFPSPAELREACHEARFARLRYEANERRQMTGPPRATASPEFVRGKLADLRRVLAEARDVKSFPSFDAVPAEVVADLRG